MLTELIAQTRLDLYIPYNSQACFCKLLSKSLCPREAAAWMEWSSRAESAGLRWPRWDNCTGRAASQRQSTLLLHKDKHQSH